MELEEVDVRALNTRAQRLGFEVIADEDPVLPRSEAGGPFHFNLAHGEYCRVYRDGQPCSRFSWRGEEVYQWLTFREREAA